MFVVVLASFLVDWAAVAFGWWKIKPAAKILAMLTVIFWTLFLVNWSPSFLIILLLLAQFFGLVGDVFLLLTNRWFIAGLGAFLIGHLLYIALIFSTIITSINLAWLLSEFLFPILITIFLKAMVLFAVYHVFRRDHFLQHRKGSLLWKLVQVYIWILSGLTTLTVFRILVQPDPDVLMVFLPLGGVLFFLSDIILAYDRFVKSIPRGQLWVHMTYHIGQLSLAVGFLSILGRI